MFRSISYFNAEVVLDHGQHLALDHLICCLCKVRTCAVDHVSQDLDLVLWLSLTQDGIVSLGRDRKIALDGLPSESSAQDMKRDSEHAQYL